MTRCILCPGGAFAVDTVHCKSCPPEGVLSPDRGDCERTCGPGQHPGPKHLLCVPCERGKYNELDAQSECSPCEPGTAEGGQGAQEPCPACESGSFHGGYGQIRCHPCAPDLAELEPSPFVSAPLNGTSFQQLASWQCVCKEGTTPALPGVGNRSQCESCPQGAVCEPGRLPYAMRGWYYTLNAPLEFLPCSPRPACTGGDLLAGLPTWVIPHALYGALIKKERAQSGVSGANTASWLESTRLSWEEASTALFGLSLQNDTSLSEVAAVGSRAWLLETAEADCIEMVRTNVSRSGSADRAVPAAQGKRRCMGWEDLAATRRELALARLELADMLAWEPNEAKRRSSFLVARIRAHEDSVLCSAGYEDLRCSKCTLGHERAGGDCAVCEDVSWLLLGGFAVSAAVMYLCVRVLLLKVGPSGLAPLTLSMEYFQLVARVSRFDIAYPESTQQSMKSSEWSEFDVSRTRLACLVKFESVEGTLLVFVLVLPALVIFGLVARLVQVLVWWVLSRRKREATARLQAQLRPPVRSRGHGSAVAAAGQGAGSLSGKGDRSHRARNLSSAWAALLREDAEEFGYSTIRRAKGLKQETPFGFNKLAGELFLLLQILYNPMLQVSLSIFDCVHLPDGTAVLEADPQVVCYSSGGHIRMMLFAGFIVLCYGIGVPFLLYRLTLRVREVGRKAIEAERAQHSMSGGSNYSLLLAKWKRLRVMTDPVAARFRPHVPYWGVVVLVRKAFLVGISVLQSARPGATALCPLSLFAPDSSHDRHAIDTVFRRAVCLIRAAAALRSFPDSRGVTLLQRDGGSQGGCGPAR